ncbi:MAG: hypothetical protein LBS55_08725 [Prevotellaceae bacterium]|nr:hypothetical protein [Prevotellaceae bacterium]
MEEKDAKDLRNSAGDFINIGSGQELPIKQLAEAVRAVIYEQELQAGDQLPDEVCAIAWDTSKPNGVSRKLCDTSRFLALGFAPKTADGIRKSYADFLQNNKRWI